MQIERFGHGFVAVGIFVSALITAATAAGQSSGDEWESRRGDLTPGLLYDAIASSGSRIIAVGNGGRLMISDDGGTNWRFDQIRVNGEAIFGTPSDMVYFQGSFIAVMAQLETGSGGPMTYAARTYLLKSSNNGVSWTVQPFPHTTAEFNGQTFHGVHVVGLQISPAGELVGFGTTSVANSPSVIWNLGGLLYRSSDGSTWVETEFAYGAIEAVSPVNGRLIAVGNTTALDSADGSAWNGYTLADANVQTPQGTLLDVEDRDRIRLFDVGVVGSTPIAIGAIFVPYNESGTIDSSEVDQAFTLSSPNPFDGGRIWTAYPRSGDFGRLFNAGSSLLSFGDGVYSVSATGQFSLIDASVRVPAATVTASGSNIIAVGSSEAVWRGTGGGSNWTRVWNRDVGPNLRVTSVVGGTIFASTNGALWGSFDSGDNWELLNNTVSIGRPRQYGDSLIAPGGTTSTLSTSDDGGRTWRPVPTQTPNVPAALMTETPTGRLILASAGRAVASGAGEFFVSDNGGQTWQPRLVGHSFGESPSAVVTTPSGAVIAASNSFSAFNPRIMFSEDNGETWTTNYFLRTLEGLNPILNEPGSTAILIRGLRASPTGRVVLLGEDEILTSDDNGRTWRVRVHLGPNQAGTGNFGWFIEDVIHTGVGTQWIAIGRYETPAPSRRIIVITMISDDDGATWRRVTLPTRQPNTIMTSLTLTPDGRIVASGTNGAVYVLDPPAPLASTPAPFSIREGTTGLIPVDRPPVPGAVEVRYSAVERSARAGVDYVSAGGVITWSAEDQEQKIIPIETIDNNAINPARELALQMVFDSDDFQASNELMVQITDDEGTGIPNVVVEGGANAVTTESGGTAEVFLSIGRRPTDPVELTLADYDETEGTLSATSFTFTAENWNIRQSLVITGVDDDLPDGDRSYEVRFLVSTNDSLFRGLPEVIIPVLNRGEESYDPVALEGANPAPTPFPTPDPTPTPTPTPGVQLTTVPPEIRVARKITSRNGKARIKGQLAGEIVRVEVKAGRGGYKNAKMRGSGARFIFKAKNLPEEGRKIKAILRAYTADGSRIVQRVRIIPK